MPVQIPFISVNLFSRYGRNLEERCSFIVTVNNKETGSNICFLLNEGLTLRMPFRWK
jgi:hypothetical protein